MEDKVKRLIAVVSCHSYQYPKPDEGAAHHSGTNEPRSQAIRNTWYKNWLKYKKHIDLKFFLGVSANGENPKPDEIFLDVPDDYYSLPEKVQKTFQWALDNGYDYVLKVDDDVFVRIERLLKEFEPADYRGFSCGWFISGAAYWISRKAMKAVTNDLWNRIGPEGWAEDKSVGRTLEKYNILPQHDERFQVCACDVCLKKFSENNQITLHTNKPETMYELFRKV